MMAGLAHANAGQQDIGGGLTSGRLRMARRANHHPMGAVVKIASREPAGGEIRFGHLRGAAGTGEIDAVTLLAGLAPQELFGLGDAPLNPFGGVAGRLGRHARRNASVGLLRQSYVAGMSRNVGLEFGDYERAHGFGILVRRGFVDALVEEEGMARRTMLVEINRLHVGTDGHPRMRRRLSARVRGLHLDNLAVGPGADRSAGAMTIVALHLDIFVRAAQLFLQMDLVIEFDGAGIGLLVAERSELRMAGGETVDAGGDVELLVTRLQVRMAARACLVASARQKRQSLVFQM